MEFFTVISPAEARKVLEDFGPREQETVALSEAAGRVSAEDIFSPEELPAFDRATMDGFAVRAADTFGASESLPAFLRLIGEVPMGGPPPCALSSGEALRIYTGGMLPRGADAVLMDEYAASADEETIQLVRSAAPWENVLRVGEDLKRGELICPEGSRLRPQDIGALAAVGITELRVWRKPRVSVIPTGDELVAPDEAPSQAQVRDINRFSLSAAVREAGGVAESCAIVRDDSEALKEAITDALQHSELILISGGSSMGRRDFTVEAIDSLGNPGVLVHGISIKPGKPTIIGKVQAPDGGSRVIIGMPGHPVSALMVFRAFIRPLIRRMEGLKGWPQDEEARLKARLSRNLPSAPGREDYVRVSLERSESGFLAHPLMGSSGSISTMVKARGYLVIPSESEGLHEGEEVEVFPF
ncbi:MAG: gephyrin-like molybdotransferase Glp [Nitrospinota bacterium]